MGTIYSRAERVIFWLGTATYETNVILESMKLVELESNKCPRNSWESSEQIRRDVWSTIQYELRRKHSGLEFLQRTGLEIIFERPWFRRVWILQEVANAKQAIVVCGTKSVSARIFTCALFLLGFQPDAHSQSVVDVMPGSSREQSWWNQNRDLHTLLAKFGKSKASDPRDHIRALLGISSDAQDGALLKAETVQEVIKETTSFLLRFPELRHSTFPPEDWTVAQFLESIHLLSNLALNWAHDTENMSFIKILLARDDVDMNLKDEKGETILLRAVGRKQKDIVALLLSREDVDVNVKDKESKTPLHIALDAREVEIIRELLMREDVGVNVKDKESKTPLHIALDAREVEIIRKLLMRDDIDVNLKDAGGILPSMKAVNSRNARVIELLLSHPRIRLPRSTQNDSKVVRKFQGIHIITGSLVDRLDYYGRFMQMSTTTFRHERPPMRVDWDSCEAFDWIGPGKYIEPSTSIYDFIKMQIQKTNGTKHRFFVFHPNTSWYPVFSQIIQETPLPPTFCAMSGDLDRLCQYMQSIRAAIQDEDEASTDIIFHLLIPAWPWFKISINESVHFSEALQPLYVEGQQYNGKELVTLNIPAAPRNLLHGVANSFDPSWLNRRATAADIAAGVTTMVATGWGVNGACLAVGVGLGAMTGLGALLAILVWWGSAAVAMPTAAEKIHRFVYDSICEAPPRILGSNSRLDIHRGN